MLVYKMNKLLLLAGLVLVLYVMNEKKVFSGLSKTLSSGKNNTMLVLVFCGVILFMCMQKGKVMEYFSLLEENSNNCGPGKKKMHIYEPKDASDTQKHLQICVERISESERVVQAIRNLGSRSNNNQDSGSNDDSTPQQGDLPRSGSTSGNDTTTSDNDTTSGTQ